MVVSKSFTFLSLKVFIQKKWMRMCRKRKAPTLLVGMQIGAATIENSMEVPLKTKNRVTILIFLSGEFHGQRSLAGYSLWGHRELDTTELLTLSLLSFFQSYHIIQQSHSWVYIQRKLIQKVHYPIVGNSTI